MKISLFVFLIIISFSINSFNFGPVSAEGGSTTPTADEQQAEETVDQLSAALAAAQQELAKNGLLSFKGFAAFKKIQSLKKKLMEAILNNDEPPSKCNAIYDSSVQRLDSAISSIERKGCTLNQRIMNRGKCAKFLNDPIKFQQCEAEEHGVKPPKPKLPSCISQDTLNSILPSLQSASENLKSLGLNDDNTNGIPNFCEK